MYIYRHHTADELLDLDDSTGIAVQVTESDGAKISVGPAPLALRARHQVRGSYTIEAGRRCACYWNDERELVFLTPDGERLVLFQMGADGRVQERMPGIGVTLAPAIVGSGKEIAGFTKFVLAHGSGHGCFETVYESMAYLTLFGLNSMLAFVPDEELSDWDFFVAVGRTVDELGAIARATESLSAENPFTAALAAGVVTADTGACCGRTGLWAACRQPEERCVRRLGEPMPQAGGQDDTWVWVGSAG
ncbi:MAG: hypothetical protein AB1437_13640 [Pseudomonadota bacterium]